ncbi:MAG: SulP family inorganic anion transporter [Planctomycetaceae bacterium]
MISNLKHWKTDIPAGLVVFLVAIPLCLGIALASDAPPLSGIIAGIVGGLVVTVFSDSSLGVSGPAAGLVAIVVTAITDLGFEHFLLAVVLCGVIQVVLGCLRAGTIGYYFPTAVIKGMLVAIGLIIVLKQIPHAVGYDKDYEGDLAFFQKDGFNTFTEIGHAFEALTPGSIVVTLVCLAILILWERPSIQKQKFATIIQGPLVAVLTGIGLTIAFRGSERFMLEAEHLVKLPTGSFLKQLQFPSLEKIGDISIFTTAFTLAIVASIESLLCAEATDKLDPQRRQTNLNRELCAQGIGNCVSGLLGGLPVTQVIVRSSTNIQSQAQSRLSAFVHGLLLLVCVASIPQLLNLIPLASLAAILFVVGYKLAHPSKFLGMFKLGWTQFLPFLITIAAILFTDLLRGIGIGLAASVFFVLKNNYVRSFWMSSAADGDRTVHTMTLAENVFFMNKGSIQSALKEIAPGSKVVIDASDTVHIDQDVIDIFNDFETHAEFENIEVVRVDFLKDAKNTDNPARVGKALSGLDSGNPH